MNKAFSFMLLCLIAGVSGCSSIYVKSDYDHEANFENYVTFKWMPAPKKRRRNSVPQGSLLDKRIRRAVEHELRARGYEVTASGPADILLAYHVNLQKRVEVSQARYGYWGWRPGYVHRYKEGSIIIDLVDPRNNQLVWRGAAIGAVGSTKASQKKISEAMAKVFKEYPPQS
ncbi:MAG: DUF4136 domain-containing protein [bacterium]